MDSRSSRLSGITEGRKHQSAWGNTQSRVQSFPNNHPHSRDSSLNSLDCRDDHDSILSIYFCCCKFARSFSKVPLEAAFSSMRLFPKKKFFEKNFLVAVGEKSFRALCVTLRVAFFGTQQLIKFCPVHNLKTWFFET